MPVNFWLNANGNIILNDAGNPILCEVCPCGEGECQWKEVYVWDCAGGSWGSPVSSEWVPVEQPAGILRPNVCTAVVYGAHTPCDTDPRPAAPAAPDLLVGEDITACCEPDPYDCIPVSIVIECNTKVDDDIRVDVAGVTRSNTKWNQGWYDGETYISNEVGPPFVPTWPVRDNPRKVTITGGLSVGDLVEVWSFDGWGGTWSTVEWTATITYSNGEVKTVTGGAVSTGASPTHGPPNPGDDYYYSTGPHFEEYHDMGSFTIPDCDPAPCECPEEGLLDIYSISGEIAVDCAVAMEGFAFKSVVVSSEDLGRSGSSCFWANPDVFTTNNTTAILCGSPTSPFNPWRAVYQVQLGGADGVCWWTLFVTVQAATPGFSHTYEFRKYTGLSPAGRYALWSGSFDHAITSAEFTLS